jgi:hypothetical protein
MVEYAATQGISEFVRWLMMHLTQQRNHTRNSFAGNGGAIAAPLLGRVPRPANYSLGCLTDRGYVMGCGPRRRSDRLWLHHKSLNRWLRPGVSRQTRADGRNRTPRQDLSIGHRQDL